MGSGNGQPGASVVVTIIDSDGTTATVNAGGSWSVTIDGSSLDDGALIVLAEETDLSGNTGSTSTLIVKDTTVGLTSVDTPIAGDNVVNSSEEGGVIFTGSGEPGSTVVVDVTDGTTTVSETVTVQSDGSWSTSALDLSGLVDTTTATVTAPETDVAGNTGSGVSLTFTIDTTAPTLTITTPVATDDIISISEEEAVTITGTGEIGSDITVVLTDTAGNTVTTTTTVNGSGAWSVTVDTSPLIDGDIDIDAQDVDVGGNTVTVSHTVSKDTVVPDFTLNTPIEGDNYVNFSESSDGIQISGTGDDGLSVTVTVVDSGSNTEIQTTTIASNTWTVTIPVGALSDGVLDVTVVGTDNINPVTINQILF